MEIHEGDFYRVEQGVIKITRVMKFPGDIYYYFKILKQGYLDSEWKTNFFSESSIFRQYLAPIPKIKGELLYETETGPNKNS